jgi:hypothetical protein
MENDYFRVPEHKSFIQNMLKEKGFRVDYQKALTDHPTFKTIEDFYEVWLR